MKVLRLRNLETSDENLLFQWRNDPWLLQFSSSQKAVSQDEHRSWFQKICASPRDHRIWIIEDSKSVPMGSLRIDRKSKDSAELSVYLEQRFTGRGLGVEALKMAVERAFEEMKLKVIHAHVRRENHASLKAFEKAGFTRENQESASSREGHIEFVYRSER